MKKILYKYALILLSTSLLITSCKKWIGPEINVDPSNPTDVPLKLLLPSAEAGAALTAGSDLIIPTQYWMQQITGLQNQSGQQETYSYAPTDPDNLWKWESYGGVMMDLNRIIGLSVTLNSPIYGGIAKTLMAYKLMTMTDLFNDVPYTEAFLGDGNLHPKYDSQETIYNNILPALLDSALANLSTPKANNIYLPGKSDDLFYKGDISKWKKAAYALKARMYIHLSKQSSTAYTNALTAISSAFTSNSDDIELAFGDNATEQNPIFQMLDQRPGYIGGMGAKLINMMNAGTPKIYSDDDPRLKVYADTISTGEYIGSPAGDPVAEPSQIGGYFASTTSPVNIISYVEIKFIEAEASFETDKARSAIAYNTAVLASLDKYGVLGSNKTWEAANVTETQATITMSKIMNAKYIALFLNNEVFSDWRRHDSEIILTPALNNSTKNIIPRRFLYPTEEVTTNGANVPVGIVITDHVWWDKSSK